MRTKIIVFISPFIILYGIILIASMRDTPKPNIRAVEDGLAGLPENITVTFNESITIELVRIPPGSFRMGTGWFILDNMPLIDSPSDVLAKPAFRATVSKGYYIGKDNINASQFAVFLVHPTSACLA